MLKYKNYIGHVEFDDEAGIFHGEVINTRDVITFQGTTVETLKQAFIESIDDYLAFCEERNEKPEKPFSGKFNVRLDPELHRAAYVAAKAANMSLNTWIITAIKHEAHVRNWDEWDPLNKNTLSSNEIGSSKFSQTDHNR